MDMRKLKKKKSGCLARVLLIILIIALAFSIYKWIGTLGSANLTISKLTSEQKTGRSGDLIKGSILINLTLENSGRQPGNFCPDLDNYRESQELEGLQIDAVWSFKSELYYPSIDRWIEFPNTDIWSGKKITPGALSITIDKYTVIELEAYLKNSRGWKIKPPSNLFPDSMINIVSPKTMRITLFSPSGNESESKTIDL
jgi:hypothetical protein